MGFKDGNGFWDSGEEFRIDGGTPDQFDPGDEFKDNPQLAKAAAVGPPVIDNKVQIVQIGEDKIIDIQACGGTHIKSTGEIGELEIGKIENKGKRNRRINVRFKQ